MMNIFVGNLDLSVSEQQLREQFSPFGLVESVTIVNDRDTGLPRGFAFIEMTQAGEAWSAITALDGVAVNGRAMRVNEARPKLLRDAGIDPPITRSHRRHRI
jgi:cold-inducible RNA-binding protein